MSQQYVHIIETCTNACSLSCPLPPRPYVQVADVAGCIYFTPCLTPITLGSFRPIFHLLRSSSSSDPPPQLSLSQTCGANVLLLVYCPCRYSTGAVRPPRAAFERKRTERARVRVTWHWQQGPSAAIAMHVGGLGALLAKQQPMKGIWTADEHAFALPLPPTPSPASPAAAPAAAAGATGP